uniref:Putative glycine rich protein n=1 Tax=Amblyomma parvum TaxID=251391 RepID=A0A023G161_AMBPA
MTAYASLVVLLALGVTSASSYVLPTLAPHPLGGCPNKERPPGDRHCNFWCLKKNGLYSEDRYADGLDCDLGRRETGECYGGLCHSKISILRYANRTVERPVSGVPTPAPEAPEPEVAGTPVVSVTPGTGESTEGQPQSFTPSPTEQPPEQTGATPSAVPPSEHPPAQTEPTEPIGPKGPGEGSEGEPETTTPAEKNPEEGEEEIFD